MVQKLENLASDKKIIKIFKCSAKKEKNKAMFRKNEKKRNTRKH